MISKQYKFMFLAIPKCAGTSVRNVLVPYSELSNFKTIYGEDYGKGIAARIWRKMFKPQKYFKTLVTEPETHLDLVKKLTQPDYFLFTFVRNPYDRVVSLWKYLKPQLSFTEFIDWLEDDDSKKSFHDIAHIKSCSYYLELYENTFSRECYIGRVENIDHDFRHVCKQIGLPFLEVPKIRQTNHKKYQEYYDIASIEKVEKIYSQDFELFNYEF